MSNPSVQTYLFFNGNCEEALAFYRDKLGAKIQFTMRYKEAPEAPPPGMVPDGWGDKLMHANLLIGDTQLMASDDCTAAGKKPAGFALTLVRPTAAEADRAFKALSDGGTVQMPMGKTFFSPRFGMLTDRFGVMWMIMVPGESPS